MKKKKKIIQNDQINLKIDQIEVLEIKINLYITLAEIKKLNENEQITLA